MSNKDFITVYDQNYADWLDEKGYPRPKVHAGNRLPTPAEILAVFRTIPDSEVELDSPYVFVVPQGESRSYIRAEAPPDTSWSDKSWEELNFFTMKPESDEIELSVVIALARMSGQLLLYPDSGRTALIVDGEDDPVALARLWGQTDNEPDPWEALYRLRHSD